MQIEREYILDDDKAQLNVKCSVAESKTGNKRYGDIHIELEADCHETIQDVLVKKAMDNFSRNILRVLNDGIEIEKDSHLDELRIIQDEEGERAIYLGNKKVQFVRSFKIKSLQGGRLALLTLKTLVKFRGARKET